MKLRWMEQEYRSKVSNRNGFLGKKHTDKFKIESSNRLKKLWNNLEFIRKMSKRNSGKFKSVEVIEKARKSGRENSINNWLNPRTRKHMMKLLFKRMFFLGKHPNYSERELEKRIIEVSKDFKFVGDGSIIINGKNPDFMNVNGKKQLIELAGRYWHKSEYEWKRPKCFSNLGYNTLIVWAEELSKENRKNLRNKLDGFVNGKEIILCRA